MPVIVDTGSVGLIVPPQDVNLASLEPVTGHGSGTYGSGTQLETHVTWDTYNATVDFGKGIVTAPTKIAVVTSVNGTSSPEALAKAPAFMGIGVNSGGPGTNPVTALPGDLSQGVLLNAPLGEMEFGPNPLPGYASLPGLPIAAVGVQFDNGTVESASGVHLPDFLNPSRSWIDSGAVDGVIPG